MKATENIARQFQTEIEVAQIRIIMEQGLFIFLVWFMVTSIVTFALWNTASHLMLLCWFAVSNVINLARLVIYKPYRKQLKTINSVSISGIKRIFLIDGLITGSCLGMGNLLLIDSTQPYTLLIMSLTVYFGALGVMFSWFNYLPAVSAFIIPAGGMLIAPLLLQDSEDSIGFMLLIAASVTCGIISCFRLRGIYSSALHLNFENVALRQKSDQARKAAEQANAAKTRFLAAASHDLRQPIHALNLFFAELSDRVRNAETNTLLTRIEESINAINSMLNALLDVSKLDAGVVRPDVKSTGLAEMFARLEAEFAPIAQENHNAFRIRNTQLVVRSDPVMLERILRNLIGNALRYTEHGRVLVAARSRGNTVQIQVLDNGPGIPEDQLGNVFIEFYQLNNPARDRRKGLGLGLAIVKRLVNLLKHNIKAASNLNRGCCFTITAPKAYVRESISNGNLIDPVQTYSFDGRAVLVLDDDIDILKGMHGLLTRWGCKVVTACSLDETFEKLAADRMNPELLIVDYRLSGNISGIEAAKKLQAQLAYPLPVLLITGDTGPERLREADASGYQLLHKPVQPAKLRSTMQYLLSKNGVF
ncbi:MAG: hybrid sensor histidine kinase/response regulator [Nitrosomonas sp.]|nr:hybrid sensor histidine kinase/response regulator [Nitrosomonas sp.]